MRVHPYKIPKEIWNEYYINIAPDGFVYLDIRKGMYGLKESGVLAFNKLVKALAPHGYEPIPNTTGLWIHKTRKTTLSLCVDNFGVKYFSKSDAHHLIDALQEKYKITLDWEGSLYCEMALKWDCSVHARIRHTSTRKFNHLPPEKPQHAPHPWVTLFYGSLQQQTPKET